MEAALTQAGFSEVRLETMSLKPAVVCALGVNRGALDGGARSPLRTRSAGAGARPSGQLGGRPVTLELAALQRPRAEILRLGRGRLGRARPIRPRPELAVEALFGYQPDRPFGEFDLYPLGSKAPRRGLLGRGTLVFFDG